MSSGLVRLVAHLSAPRLEPPLRLVAVVVPFRLGLADPGWCRPQHRLRVGERLSPLVVELEVRTHPELRFSDSLKVVARREPWPESSIGILTL